MSIANKTGGYFLSLLVDREGLNTSATALTEELITKAENYTLHVQHFITNQTQRLNTINEIYFEALNRGTINDGEDEVYHTIPVHIRQFIPNPYFSTLELGRQMEQYFLTLDLFLGFGFIDFTLNRDGTFAILLKQPFHDFYYLKIGPRTQQLTGLFPHLFVMNDGYNDIVAAPNVVLFDEEGDFRFNVFEEGQFDHNSTEQYRFTSARPINSFDLRLSTDIIGTFPISTKPSVIHGKETNQLVLARFPSSNYQLFESKLGMGTQGIVQDATTLQERINVGTENRTQNNSSTISNHLMNGRIKICNFRIEQRFYENGIIVTEPCDFSNGFFSLKLILAKKET